MLYAGTNEFYRWGKKAQERMASALVANENGYYSIYVDGGKYYEFGVSVSQYGPFIKINDTFFSVNRGGYAYVKADSPKAEVWVKFFTGLIEQMKRETNPQDYEVEIKIVGETEEEIEEEIEETTTNNNLTSIKEEKQYFVQFELNGQVQTTPSMILGEKVLQLAQFCKILRVDEMPF